jgi:gluconolactonase
MLTVHHPQLHEIIRPEAHIKPVVTGFDFLEGPIWNPLDQSVIFSDLLGNSIYRWREKDGVSTLRRNSYMANGNAYDSQGRVVTCEHATSRLTRTDFAAGGELEVLASHYQDRQLNSPNDVVVKADGTIYFTDPTSGRSAGWGVPRAPELDFSGVYRFDPATTGLTLLVEDFEKPNGLCFSPHESLLYINDTVRQHIRVFEAATDGSITNGRLFADLEGALPGVADGMKVDSAGHVYSCGPGGIHIFNPDGECLGIVAVPEFTTNFAFGGRDLCTLYITASTTLYSLRVQVPGHNTFRGEGYDKS